MTRIVIRQAACACCEAWRGQVDAVQDHPDPKRVLELLTAAVPCMVRENLAKHDARWLSEIEAGGDAK